MKNERERKKRNKEQQVSISIVTMILTDASIVFIGRTHEFQLEDIIYPT